MRGDLRAAVMDVFQKRGTTNLDQLVVLLPEYKRSQLKDVLKTARDRGLVHVKEPLRHGGRASKAVQHYDGPPPEPKVEDVSPDSPHLVDQVVAEVVRLGKATIRDIATRFTDKTREQLGSALRKGYLRGELVRFTKGSPGRGGRDSGVWAAADRPAEAKEPKARGRPLGRPAPSPFPTAEIVIRPPASVWELGHGLQIAGDWPPAGEGRAFMLLSAGDVEDAHSDCA